MGGGQRTSSRTSKNLSQTPGKFSAHEESKAPRNWCITASIAEQRRHSATIFVKQLSHVQNKAMETKL
jgi:hypothetical protein